VVKRFLKFTSIGIYFHTETGVQLKAIGARKPILNPKEMQLSSLSFSPSSFIVMV
jgi:hypothetical protein